MYRKHCWLKHCYWNCNVTIQSYLIDVHQIFTQCSWIIAMLSFLSCLIGQSIVERQSKVWRQSILTSAKSPQNWLVTIATSLGLLKTYVSFIMPMHMSTNAENLVKIGPVVAEIFGEICWFLLSRAKRCSCNPCNLCGYWTYLHRICIEYRQDIAIEYFWIRSAVFQSVLEWQSAEWRSFCQFSQNLVSMQRPLRNRKKKSR